MAGTVGTGVRAACRPGLQPRVTDGPFTTQVCPHRRVHSGEAGPGGFSNSAESWGTQAQSPHKWAVSVCLSPDQGCWPWRLFCVSGETLLEDLVQRPPDIHLELKRLPPHSCAAPGTVTPLPSPGLPRRWALLQPRVFIQQRSVHLTLRLAFNTVPSALRSCLPGSAGQLSGLHGNGTSNGWLFLRGHAGCLLSPPCLHTPASHSSSSPSHQRTPMPGFISEDSFPRPILDFCPVLSISRMVCLNICWSALDP